jgi:hypothetical protein
MALTWMQQLYAAQAAREAAAKQAQQPKVLDPGDFGMIPNSVPSYIRREPAPWSQSDQARVNFTGQTENYNGGDPHTAWNNYNANMNRYQAAQIRQLQGGNGMGGMGGGPQGYTTGGIEPKPAVGGMGGGQGLGAARRQHDQRGGGGLGGK